LAHAITHDLNDRRHQPGLPERVELLARLPRVDDLDVVALHEPGVEDHSVRIALFLDDL
jgi:hypothetical protein